MANILTLSPVHVGTGEDFDALCYKVNLKENKAYRYDFADVITQLPPKEILNQKTLRELSNKDGQRKLLYKEIRDNANFNSLNPLYACEYHLAYDLHDDPFAIMEQVKDLQKPYIPGSTLKGAIFNALYYYALKHNYPDRRTLDNTLHDFNDRRGKLDEGFILSLLFGRGKANDRNEFMKKLHSCMICRDVFFDKLALYQSDRYSVLKQGSIPTGYAECISENQKVKIDELYILDTFKINQLRKEYMYLQGASQLLDLLTKDKISLACNTYTLDILEEERTKNLHSFYNDFYPINKQVENLHKSIEQDLKAQDILYLRIGKGTNYFFKSITYLFKKNSSELYKRYYNFVFSPNKKSNPATVPSTRTIYEAEKPVLPGFIKVSYD